MNMEFLQRGRATVRFHGIRMHDHQRIDAHSYGVAMVVLQILGPNVLSERKARLLEAALKHDLAEHIAGDLPAPTKRHLQIREQFGAYEDSLLDEASLAIPALNDNDQRVLKMADAAEGCLHCIEERRMGNQDIARIFYTFWDYCVSEQKMARISDCEYGEVELNQFIRSQWVKFNGGSW